MERLLETPNTEARTKVGRAGAENPFVVRGLTEPAENYVRKVSTSLFRGIAVN